MMNGIWLSESDLRIQRPVVLLFLWREDDHLASDTFSPHFDVTTKRLGIIIFLLFFACLPLIQLTKDAQREASVLITFEIMMMMRISCISWLMRLKMLLIMMKGIRMIMAEMMWVTMGDDFSVRWEIWFYITKVHIDVNASSEWYLDSH